MYAYVNIIIYIFLLEIPISSSRPVSIDSSPDSVSIIVGACAGGVLALLVVIVVVSYIVVMICHAKKTDNQESLGDEVYTNVILNSVNEAKSKDEPFYDQLQFNDKETAEVHFNPVAQGYATRNFDHSDSYTRKPTPSCHDDDYGPIRSPPDDKFDIESHATKVSSSSQIPDSVKPTAEGEYGPINQPTSDILPTVEESPATKESCSSQTINSVKPTEEE